MAEIVAQTYAGALFDAASDLQNTDEVQQALLEIGGYFAENPGFVKLLSSPQISREEKQSVLDAVFEGRIQEQTLNLLRLLIDNGRIREYPAICQKYKELYNKYYSILEITAVTAVKLRPELAEKLAQKLSAGTGKKVVIHNQVDASVLGGIKLICGNQEADSSLRKRLRGIGEQLRSTIVQPS